MFSQPRRSQWPPSYSWEFPGTLHRTLPGPVLWHQIFISENFSLCNSLDQNQIFSVHFSEVLYGAAPASELIVWIVLSHHYSIVVPAHQTWLTSLCSVKTYIIAPCSFLLRIHILFRWYWVSAHNTSSLQPGCRSTYRDTCRWGPGWRPPQCSQWRGGWQWRKESPWCRARWCPPGRPACSDRWPGRRPRWEPGTDCPRPDTCTDLKTDLCQAGSDVTAHLLTGSCCQLAGWWTARQARRESRWRHFIILRESSVMERLTLKYYIAPVRSSCQHTTILQLHSPSHSCLLDLPDILHLHLLHCSPRRHLQSLRSGLCRDPPRDWSHPAQ